MIRYPFVVAFALSSALFASAQTAPAAPAPKAEEADPVLLSPFVVQAEKDIGYVA